MFQMTTIQRCRRLQAIRYWVFLVILLGLALFAEHAFAGKVTLQWDANDPAPEGYRIFVRQPEAEESTGNKTYNYATPAWQGAGTSAELDLPEGILYAFVVRAYDGVLESPDSQEVNYRMPNTGIAVPKTPIVIKVIIEITNPQ